MSIQLTFIAKCSYDINILIRRLLRKVWGGGRLVVNALQGRPLSFKRVWEGGGLTRPHLTDSYTVCRRVFNGVEVDEGF